ncbi:CCA tRNA nucleotidyltransferase [Lachnobacterium bovis]|uniref:tRNA nucleotidyltransferase (CCA-adding enzyme) n=1 Tax=Lachnobacterium bovis TaxID=140626 RepID=A0A1H9SQH3_9FIRM|nr:CCA tRNA nucleotidyltransferase [Lachnobacterium bovis]SER86589.1 tRNA nucleotidyltransferase (CCA-adding enzyme) [Lachnobacterium bovis]
MKINLPESVKKIINVLEENGYEGYAVGGCVRDTILSRSPQDWDITTSAKPEEVKSLFPHTIDTGIEHGTVTVMDQHIGYEVTTYRIDGEYEDARHPKNVFFTPKLEEDLKRRDFTINAMAYNEKDGLVDLFEGKLDLERKIIRCVGNPMERFSEDALRMLRAVRFAAQLGFSIDEETKKAIKELAPTIQKVSAERIQVEMVKLLVSDHPEEILTAYELGLTKIFLPEFDEMMQTKQNSKHHMYTVGEHSVKALQNIKNDKVLRITMLLHDVAKPKCKVTDANGADHFKGHQEEGAKMAKVILKRLKFDNATINQVVKLIKAHDDRPNLDEKSIRHAMNDNGLECYPDLFDVQKADCLAQSEYNRDKKIVYLEKYVDTYKSIIDKEQCVSLKEMKINGNDLIQLGIRPGKELGEMLRNLFNKVLDEPELNEKEKLVEMVKKLQK